MIVFTDIDGTLYDYEGRMPESTRTALRKLKENGHLVYFVTGRSKAENKKELWDMGLDGIICANGAYIEDRGEVIFHKTLSKDECAKIVDWCKERDLGFYEESNNGLFVSDNFYKKAGAAIVTYAKGKGEEISEASEETINEMIHGLVKGADLYRDDVNKISFALNTYEDYLEAKEIFADLTVGTWGGKGEEALFGDVGIKDVDKASAIRILLKHLGKDLTGTYAIGDSRTDIPMLELCETGITFMSGGEEIKAMADYVSDDVDKDGFYMAFEHFGLI